MVQPTLSIQPQVRSSPALHNSPNYLVMMVPRRACGGLESKLFVYTARRVSQQRKVIVKRFILQLNMKSFLKLLLDTHVHRSSFPHRSMDGVCPLSFSRNLGLAIESSSTSTHSYGFSSFRQAVPCRRSRLREEYV